MTVGARHPQLRDGEVFIGQIPYGSVAAMQKKWATLRVGDSVRGGAWSGPHFPLFISREEAQRKNVSVDEYGNGTPAPELF